MTEDWKQQQAATRLTELTKQVQQLTAENVELSRAAEGLVNERELTPDKLNKLQHQADCCHPTVPDKVCLECGRTVLKDVHDERAATLLRGLSGLGHSMTDLHTTRTIGRLLRDTAPGKETSPLNGKPRRRK